MVSQLYKEFIDHLNTLHPTIKFINEIPHEIPFLDFRFM